MDTGVRRVLPCLAAVLVGAGLLPAAANACDRSESSSASGSSADSKHKNGRVTALMQRSISQAAKQMREQVKLLKTSTESLIDGLASDPALADISSLSDADLAAFIDGTLMEIDAMVQTSQEKIQAIKADAATALKNRNAPEGAFRRLEQAATCSVNAAMRTGDRAGDHLDHKIAELLSDSGSDDESGDDSGSDAPPHQ